MTTPACIQAEADLFEGIELGQPPFSANESTARAWDEFARQSEIDLHCIICREVLIDPVAMTCCGAAACLLCLDRERVLEQVEQNSHRAAAQSGFAYDPTVIVQDRELVELDHESEPIYNLAISRSLLALLEFYCGKAEIDKERERRLVTIKKLIANRELAEQYLKSERCTLLDSICPTVALKLIQETNPRWLFCTQDQFALAVNAQLKEMSLTEAGRGEIGYYCKKFTNPIVNQDKLLLLLHPSALFEQANWTEETLQGLEFAAMSRVLPLQGMQKYLSMRNAPDQLQRAFQLPRNLVEASLDDVAVFVGELDPEDYKSNEQDDREVSPYYTQVLPFQVDPDPNGPAVRSFQLIP